MGYDHLIVPGADYKQTREFIVHDVEAQGGTAEEKKNEIRRRLNWACMEESTMPCE
jgi:hypothetical protein